MRHIVIDMKADSTSEEAQVSIDSIHGCIHHTTLSTADALLSTLSATTYSMTIAIPDPFP